MRIAKNLQRLSDGGTGFALVVRDALMKAASYIIDLETALRKYRRDHDSVCQYARAGGEPCNCGADAYNAVIDSVLARGEMDPHKEAE